MTETDSIIQNLNDKAQLMLEATQNMGQVIEFMRMNSLDSSKASGIMSSACEQMQSFIREISSSVGSMSSGLQELVNHANTLRQISKETTELVAASQEMVQYLSDHSQEVEHIVSFIDSISSQTRMLALNATIEAARAGEVGRGFAVVATEVKSLAKDSSSSAKNIRQKISAMQNEIVRVVNNMGAIDQSVSRLTEFQHSVTLAIEEQFQTSAKINQSFEETQKLSHSIAEQAKNVENSSVQMVEFIEDSASAIEMLVEIANNVNDSSQKLQAPIESMSKDFIE